MLGEVTGCQGILGNVTLGGTVLRGWRITSFPLDRPARLQRYTAKALRAAAASPEERVRLDAVLERTAGSLTIWAGEFLLAAHQLRDTFLALPGWGKGVAFINQLHLGRYWPVVGPQQAGKKQKKQLLTSLCRRCTCRDLRWWRGATGWWWWSWSECRQPASPAAPTAPSSWWTPTSLMGKRHRHQAQVLNKLARIFC